MDTDSMSKRCSKAMCIAFKLRHSNHKVEIRNQRGGLGHHFGGQNGCGYQNVLIKIIDQMEHGNKTGLENCEIYWQNQMRCYVENGGGGCCYRKEETKLTQTRKKLTFSAKILTHQSNCVQVLQSSASNMLKEDSLCFQFGMETLLICL